MARRNLSTRNGTAVASPGRLSPWRCESAVLREPRPKSRSAD